MLIYLMLSQRFLNLSFFVCLFYCSAWVVCIIISSRLFIRSPAFSNLMLIPSNVFLISTVVFFSSDWLFLNFLSLCQSCCFVHLLFFHVQWASLWPLLWIFFFFTLNSSLGKSCISISFSSFSEVLSYFFCLEHISLCSHFSDSLFVSLYWVGHLLLILKAVVLYRRHPMRLGSTLTPVTRNGSSRGIPCIGCVYTFLLWQSHDFCGYTGEQVWQWLWWPCWWVGLALGTPGSEVQLQLLWVCL